MRAFRNGLSGLIGSAIPESFSSSSLHSPTFQNFAVKSVKSVNCVNAIFLSLATFDLCAQPWGIHLLLQRNDAVELVRTRDRSAAFIAKPRFGPLHCLKHLAASGHQRVIHAEAA